MRAAQHPRGTPTFRRCGVRLISSSQGTTFPLYGRVTPTSTPSSPPETWKRNSSATERR
ncbi:expressed unknown protein [Ectocarpus siliculosus]|uniref:Uncharacterized protein n=1 Tax=Ectocarpus siliculosus TaxID=2880 RepID=D7FJY5_ECTSI|nr:expressed unknown protein [Ectocarpus siliculosus]|eukprot:CBJ29233.1 expressed unknown protein [Ectocarpus siliculosus]